VRTPRSHRLLLTAIGAGTSLACGTLTGCSSGSPAVPARQESAPVTVPHDSTVRSAATPKGLVPGVDVSAYQPHVNWTSVKATGAKFAYVKATEGVKYKSSTFTAQYTGARTAGLTHGAYHFATPNTASGVAQADYFVAHGGGGKADGSTLPGVLDIENNPYGKDKCYGMSHAKMNSWITAFLHEYRARTGRHAVINTFKDWWIACTGNAGAKSGSTFGATYPLWVNDHKAGATSVPVPSAWKSYTVWQWTDKGTYGDEDYIKSSTVYKKLLA
jgi:GH25 family lysozyme M1 (1,4-beta-N-acetylmuramidase)